MGLKLKQLDAMKYNLNNGYNFVDSTDNRESSNVRKKSLAKISSKTKAKLNSSNHKRNASINDSGFNDEMNVSKGSILVVNKTRLKDNLNSNAKQALNSLQDDGGY